MFHWEQAAALPPAAVDVTAVGEVLIDMISHRYDSDFVGDSFSSHFGGSPANVAMNVRRLGWNAAIITSVGREPFGQFIVGALKEAGVNTQGVVRQAQHPTSMVVVSKSRHSPRFIAYRQADRYLEPTEAALALAASSRILHFTSWPISLEPARSTVQELLAVARQQGRLIGFDPNYRDVLWEQGHDGRAFITELLPLVDVVKPSDDDAEHIFGPGSPEIQLQRFLDCGVPLVMLTLGSEGCLVGCAGDVRHLPTLATEVVDTTGAGDAFWSGFYSGLLAGLTVEKALRRGSATAAYKLTKTGAVVDLSLAAIQPWEGD